jgi:NADPH:quinone reductase
MQAIVVAALGDSSRLQLRTDVPVPPAAPGHVLVKLEYAGVNYIDIYFRSGLYPTQLPYTPGAHARSSPIMPLASPCAQSSTLPPHIHCTCL